MLVSFIAVVVSPPRPLRPEPRPPRTPPRALHSVVVHTLAPGTPALLPVTQYAREYIIDNDNDFHNMTMACCSFRPPSAPSVFLVHPHTTLDPASPTCPIPFPLFPGPIHMLVMVIHTGVYVTTHYIFTRPMPRQRRPPTRAASGGGGAPPARASWPRCRASSAPPSAS